MRRISEKQLESLAAELRRQVAVYAPEWTDFEESDPGDTLVELFAFLAENLLQRNVPLAQRSDAAAARLSRAAGALSVSPSSTPRAGRRRVNDFEGRVLAVDDLKGEQPYVRARLSRRNRALHGAGIVTGLGVSIARSSGPSGDQLIVEPGLAFDGRGNEIEIPELQALPLPTRGTTLAVLVRHAERTDDPASASGGSGSGDPPAASQPSRIAETFVLGLAPKSDADSLPLGRLTFKNGRWRVDPRFSAGG